MEMILRAPKLSEERRRLPVAPPQSLEPSGLPPVGPLQVLPDENPSPTPQSPAESALESRRQEEFARQEAVREAREAAERLAQEEAARAQELTRTRALQEESAREEARQRAYAEGLEQGRADGFAQVEATVAQLRALAVSLEKARALWLSDREDDLVSVAYEAVCRICGPALAKPETIREHVLLTLQQVRTRTAVTVRLAAADVQKLRELADAGVDPWEGRAVDFLADPSMDTGGCVIETDSGTLEARLRHQFEKLLEVLLAARRSVQAAA